MPAERVTIEISLAKLTPHAKEFWALARAESRALGIALQPQGGKQRIVVATLADPERPDEVVAVTVQRREPSPEAPPYEAAPPPMYRWVPGPDCIAAAATTDGTLLWEQIAEGFWSFCRAEGLRPVGDPAKTEQMHVRLSPLELERLSLRARREGLSLSVWIRQRLLSC